MKPFSILLLVGALFIAVALLTTHWVAGGYDGSTFHAGLYSSGFCHDGDCESKLMLSYFGRGGPRAMATIGLGMLTLLGGLTSCVLAVIAGIATTKGRRGPAAHALLFTAITGFVGLVFLAVTHGITPTDWGYSTPLFLLGVGGVVTGAALALKAFPLAPRPMMMMGYGQPMGYGMPGMPPVYGQPPGMPPAYGQPPGYVSPQQMQPQTPPCNQCGGQTQFVQQYQKLFCGRCNRYLV